MREKPTQITPTPDDEELCAWLAERYSGDEYAHRIQVCQWINSQRGEVVFTLDQKVDATDAKNKASKPRLTREKIVEISNKIVAAAQADCDALRRSTVYAVLSFHPAMGSDSYARHLLRCAPKNALAVDVSAVVGEDNIMSTKLLLGLLESERRDKRWMVEQALNVISGAAERDAARIAALETIADGTWQKQAKLLEATEAALSMADERRLKREIAQVKVDMIKEGIATVKSMVPGLTALATGGKVGVLEGLKAFCSSLTDDQKVRLFGKWTDANTQTAPGILDAEQARLFNSVVDGRAEPSRLGDFINSLRSDQFAAVKQALTQDQLFALHTLGKAFEPTSPVYVTNGASDAPPGGDDRSTAKSPEQEIIEKFLYGAKETGVDIQLFGDWEKGENGLARCVTPGIVTPDQFGLLIEVWKGIKPASAIDDLMPTSGKPVAITAEQQIKMGGLLSKGLQESLADLIQIRLRAAQSNGAN